MVVIGLNNETNQENEYTPKYGDEDYDETKTKMTTTTTMQILVDTNIDA